MHVQSDNGDGPHPGPLRGITPGPVGGVIGGEEAGTGEGVAADAAAPGANMVGGAGGMWPPAHELPPSAPSILFLGVGDARILGLSLLNIV